MRVPLTTAAARILDTDELTPQARRALGNLIGDIARWRDMARDLPHAELARQLLDESGYTAMWQAEKSAEAAGRLENLTELVRAMEEYEIARRVPRTRQPRHGHRGRPQRPARSRS